MASKIERVFGVESPELARVQERIVAAQTRDVSPFENGKELTIDFDLADPSGNVRKLSHGLKRKPRGYIVTWQESLGEVPIFEPIYLSVREAGPHSISLGLDNDSGNGKFRVKIWVY